MRSGSQVERTSIERLNEAMEHPGLYDGCAAAMVRPDDLYKLVDLYVQVSAMARGPKPFLSVPVQGCLSALNRESK